MEKLKNRLKLILVIVLIVCGWVGWFILKTYFNDFNFNWYFIIPSFFLVFGFINIQVLGKLRIDNPRKPVNIFMLMRLIKFVLSFLLLGIYYFANGKENFREFAFVFALFYFIYLALETMFYYQTEKSLKKNL